MEDRVDLSNLQFHEKLGEGEFGTVSRVTFKTPYKGYKEAAAKSVRSVNPEEVEIMCKLNHLNIIKVLVFYTNGPINIILQEEAPFGTLHDYLADETKPLPLELKHRWFQESALAVGHLHGQNFLHKDIKAKNCFLFDDYTLKLGDFGLARAASDSPSTPTQRALYCYMAPEILKENEQGRAVYTKPADIYSYGMLMLEIYTRKPPYDGIGWQTVIFKVESGENPEIPESCPQFLSDLMRCCWMTDPKKRPTIQDIIIGLHKGVFSRSASLQYQQLLWSGGDQGFYTSVQPRQPTHQEQAWLHRLGQQQSPSQPLTMRSKSANTPGSAQHTRNQGAWIHRHTIYPRHQDTRRMRACRIACCPNKDLVVGGNLPGQVYIVNLNGTYKMQLTTPKDDKKAQIGTVWSLAVTRQGDILVADDTRYLKVFNIRGQYQHCFTTSSSSDIVLDGHGNVVVGDTVYTCLDGKFKNTLNCYGERHMAINSQDQIIFNYFAANSVYDKIVVIDCYGNEVFAFTPELNEDVADKLVIVQGIKCDAYDNIYVAMSVRRNYEVLPNTGHVHKYSSSGSFLRCVASGLQNPTDLALEHDGSLVVADFSSILICSKKHNRGMSI